MQKQASTFKKYSVPNINRHIIIVQIQKFKEVRNSSMQFIKNQKLSKCHCCCGLFRFGSLYSTITKWASELLLSWPSSSELTSDVIVISEAKKQQINTHYVWQEVCLAADIVYFPHQWPMFVHKLISRACNKVQTRTRLWCGLFHFLARRKNQQKCPTFLLLPQTQKGFSDH